MPSTHFNITGFAFPIQPAAGTYPTAGQVYAGVVFGPTNNLTGTLTLPTAHQVLLGVEFGAGGTAYTGDVTLPTTGQVQSGVTFGSLLSETGTFFGGATPTQIADAVLNRVLEGGADGGHTLGSALAFSRNRIAFDIPVVGQFTVYHSDGITPWWTGSYARGSSSLGPLTGTVPGS